MVLRNSLPFGNVCAMNKLLAYIKQLGKADRIAFFSAIGTTEGYVRKVASAGKLLGVAICVAIEQQSQRVVTRKDLRPDDWHLLWPELREIEEASQVECPIP